MFVDKQRQRYGNQKTETFVEKLKDIQRQYISLEYRLNKLIEENTREKQVSLHELISARKAAEILHCTARNVPRIAEREHLFVLQHGNQKLNKKSQIEEPREPAVRISFLIICWAGSRVPALPFYSE